MSSFVRQQDILLADGTFRVVLTKGQRLYAAIDAPNTRLGPMHMVFELDRRIHPELLHRHELAMRGLHPPYIEVGGIFDDIGRAVGRAAEGAFNKVSKVATTISRPAFNVTKHAISHATRGIAQVTPFLPSKVRKDIRSAANVVARARLGDVTAKQFIRTIGQAAKAGVSASRKIGDALLDGSRLVSRVIDVPVHLLKHVPGVGSVVTSMSPFQKFDRMVGALQRGDFRALKDMVKSDLSMAQGVIAFIPGIGTGVSMAISAGLAALEGGSPLEVAVRTAYGAIPIPPGIKNITDAVLGSVLELAKTGRIDDAVLAAAREKVPSGLPRDVFDTLVRIVAKKVPVQKAAGALASHYVSQYAGKAGSELLAQAQKQLSPQLAQMARTALPIGDVARPILRPLASVGAEPEFWLGGEDPVAYAVAGEDPVAYEVAGDEPFAYRVAGDEDAEFVTAGEGDEYSMGFEPFAAPMVDVSGEDETYDVAGEDLPNLAVDPEMIARLPHPSEWRTMRAQSGA